MTVQVSIKQRGCGFPKVGMIYLTVPTDSEKGGFYGNPIWNNVLCVPVPPHPDFKLSYLGMQCISRGVTNAHGQEIYDIWDWIGASAYPNVADWILEVSKLGFHQLIEKSFSFDKLTPESYYYAVHSQACIAEPKVYFKQRIYTDYPLCPQRHEQHMNLTEEWINKFGNDNTCSGLYFNDIVDGKMVSQSREVLRTMPSFEYKGYMAPSDAKDIEHYPGVFFRIPIGRIGSFTIYEDKQQNEHELALRKLEALDEKLKKIKLVSL